MEFKNNKNLYLLFLKFNSNIKTTNTMCEKILVILISLVRTGRSFQYISINILQSIILTIEYSSNYVKLCKLKKFDF